MNATRFLGVSSVLGIALGLAPARATLISSGEVDLAIPTDFEGIYIDIDTGANAFTPFTGWDFNPFFGGVEIANSASLQPVRTGTGIFDPIVNLPFDTVVGPETLTFASGFGGSDAHLGPDETQFHASVVGYVGFRFTTNDNAGPYYGWFTVVFTPNTAGGVIESWHYDDTGGPVTVPEPGSSAVGAGIAALACACLGSRRRRR
jgi:hypothetical protein